MKSKHEIFTIGHSTHSIDDFVEMLRAHGIERLVDIRTIPKSRYNPQFNKESLSKSLRNKGINYRYMKGLGGLRHTTNESANKGWRNKSFRGYADYMSTENFEQQLHKLIDLSKEKSTAIMCAESVPWRCHRSLVADALTARKLIVKHIMSKTSAKCHTLSSMAVLQEGHLIYPIELPLK